MKLGSLFDGIGGWQLAAVHAGVEPVWSSEIEQFPCECTKKHFPNTRQLGDITKIDGAEIEPVDIICAGSPCQNLSIAGNRKGLAGEQSRLFSAAINIIRQMQRATDNKYPRFFVWENVPGAFSSNKGFDFKAVLEEILQTEIPMPRFGKWAQSGLVRRRGSELAWRVLDAQYWGVPQRRKRIFLVTDFTGQCAGEILFECKGMSGDTSESRKKKGDIAAVTSKGIRASGFNGDANIMHVLNDKTPALKTTTRVCTQIYDMTHANDVIRKVNGGIVQTLTSRMGTGGNQIPLMQKSYCIAGNIIGRKPGNGGNGTGINDNLSFTLTATDRHAVVYRQKGYGNYKKSAVSHTLLQRDYKSATDLCVSASAVRRLTPLECERLQGLPDNWTTGGSDTARYKAIGNGMAQPCADWIIKRITEVNKM